MKVTTPTRAATGPNDAPSEERRPLVARDIERLIADRHPVDSISKEWALFFELRSATGHNDGNRRLDAFAIHMYPSKKHWRVAYEIKVSRADFLAELKSPEKRDYAMEISNEFWFACAPGVAKPDEIPAGCGLLVAQGDKLVRLVAAKQRKAREFTVSEVAAIARQSVCHETYRDVKWRFAGQELDEEALDQLVEKRYDAAKEAAFKMQAETRYVNKVYHLVEAIRHLKGVLEAAGLAPMPWMAPVLEAQGDDYLAPFRQMYTFNLKQAQQWVDENVVPGPNASEIAKILQDHRELKGNVKRLLSMIGSLGEDLAGRLETAESELVGALKRKSAPTAPPGLETSSRLAAS